MSKFKSGDIVEVDNSIGVIIQEFRYRNNIREIGRDVIRTIPIITYVIILHHSDRCIVCNENIIKMIQPVNYKIKSLFKGRKDASIWMLNSIIDNRDSNSLDIVLRLINENKEILLIPFYRLYQKFEYLYGIGDKVIQTQNLLGGESEECIIKDITITYNKEIKVMHTHLNGLGKVLRSNVYNFELLEKYKKRTDFKNLKGMKRALAKLKAKGYCLEYVRELERKYA